MTRSGSGCCPPASCGAPRQAADQALPSRPQQAAAWLAAGLIAVLSIRPTLNLLSAGQIMNNLL